MEGSISPNSNKLLELASAEAFAYMSPHLQLTRYATGTVLHEPGQALRHAVFPVSGLIGRIAMTKDGKSTALTISGREGMIGIGALLGGRPLVARTMVLCDVTAFKLPSPVVLSAWRRFEAFQRLALRYVRATLQEVMQIALCNKHHTVEQQLSRWLLMASDRLGEPRMHITQSLISHMLGVRREGVTEAAGRLEAHGIVKRERGGMTITDREGLQMRCCECYGAITSQYENLAVDAANNAFEGDLPRNGK